MKHLVETKDGIWVYSNDRMSIRAIPLMFRVMDVGIFDLDDCDVKSVAKEMAYVHAKSIRAFNPRFICWALETAWKLVKEGKHAESETWKKYVGLFLRDERNVKRELEYLTKRGVIEKLVFPGVKAFYSALPKLMEKIYFTRNIQPIAKLFADYLGLGSIHSEVSDKAKEMERFLKNHPYDAPRILVKEDDEEAGRAMLDVLAFFKRKRKVSDYTGILVTNSPDIENDKFDLITSENHLGLARLIISP